jgi:hypothetical protein
MTSHIQIITLPNENFRPSYLISRLAMIWQEQGHKITIGPPKRLDGDIGILHIDRTWISDTSLPDNPKGRLLLNGSILDISKRRISSNLLGRDYSYIGPVIIKTNANCFGWPERSATSSWTMLRFYQKVMEKNLSWRLKQQFPPGGYPVLDSIGDIPACVWRRDDLVVEKFLPEMEGDEFVLRMWVFFGDKEYGIRMFSRNPVVKAGGITRYEYINNVPDSIRKVRDKLGMDFGKFDYVIVNGDAVLLDVNKTPTVVAPNPSNTNSPNIILLASGLIDFLEGNK